MLKRFISKRSRIPPRILRPRPGRVRLSALPALYAPLTGRAAHRSRRGATLVETAIVLNVFLLLVMGGMDLGLATYKYNTLSQAARQGARQATVHGSLAAPAMTAWGPGTYTGTAGDGSQYAQAVSPILAGFALGSVTIQAEWIDGSNATQQRVRFTVTTTYRPIVTSIFTQSSFVLSAASTMPIAH